MQGEATEAAAQAPRVETEKVEVPRIRPPGTERMPEREPRKPHVTLTGHVAPEGPPESPARPIPREPEENKPKEELSIERAIDDMVIEEEPTTEPSPVVAPTRATYDMLEDAADPPFQADGGQHALHGMSKTAPQKERGFIDFDEDFPQPPPRTDVEPAPARPVNLRTSIEEEAPAGATGPIVYPEQELSFPGLPMPKPAARTPDAQVPDAPAEEELVELRLATDEARQKLFNLPPLSSQPAAATPSAAAETPQPPQTEVPANGESAADSPVTNELALIVPRPVTRITFSRPKLPSLPHISVRQSGVMLAMLIGVLLLTIVLRRKPAKPVVTQTNASSTACLTREAHTRLSANERNTYFGCRRRRALAPVFYCRSTEIEANASTRNTFCRDLIEVCGDEPSPEAQARCLSQQTPSF